MIEALKLLIGDHKKQITMACGKTLEYGLFTLDVKDSSHVASGDSCHGVPVYIRGESSGEAVEKFTQDMEKICVDCNQIQKKGT